MIIFLQLLFVLMAILGIIALIFERTESGCLLPLSLILAGSLFIANEYLGREQLTGTIVMINKEKAVVSTSITNNIPSVSVNKSNSLLEEYQVAIQLEGKEEIVVLNNKNSLLHWKWNQTPLQIQMQLDKKYRIRVTRLVGTKNILSIVEQ